MHRELYVSEKLMHEGSDCVNCSETYNSSALNCSHHDSRDGQTNRWTIGVTITLKKCQNIESF